MSHVLTHTHTHRAPQLSSISSISNTCQPPTPRSLHRLAFSSHTSTLKAFSSRGFCGGGRQIDRGVLESAGKDERGQDDLLRGFARYRKAAILRRLNLGDGSAVARARPRRE